ncbi:hypothetical protein B0H10DRAFT_2232461 [Mycena sp. CBHHK59/15]|nr:hypothetical protein B0H10DRAFT_2232461 [Mycena sp. CBHHK59/15]
MSSTSSDTIGPTYAQIFGPVFWGFCVALILCGVSTLQGYLYFTRYNDKLPVKLLAASMLFAILDFLSMALISQSMYYYMLPYYGSLAPLAAVTNELVVECLISAVITFTSQMYFVYQLHTVKRAGNTTRMMTALVVAFGTIGLGGAAGCVGLMFMFPRDIFTHRNHTFAVILAGIAKGFGAAADIVATIAMCLFLKSANTGITRTSSLLRSLMHLVINRGLLVTAAQILLLITFFATAGHLYWLAVHINTTKLYVNTFFGMLNARTALQDAHNSRHMTLDSSARRSTAVHMASVANDKKVGDFDSEDYSMGAIRVTTTLTTADM